MGSISRRETGTAEELLPTRPSLLARLRNHEDSRGWQRGWEEFYARYGPLVLRYALRHGLAEEDAEDVVQEIVSGVARSIPQFKYDPGKSSFKTWLFRIARNKIVDHQRRQGRQANGPLVSASRMEENALEALADVPDNRTLTPEEEWDAAFEIRVRDAALDYVGQRVKPMTMRLYLYHVVDGHDVAETVAHFRDSQVTAAAVHLAKCRVQKMVEKAVSLLRVGKALE